MTDNYNDDYREVIPEEEKTETTLNENRDNEKNSENTQVADTVRGCLLHLPKTGEQSRQNVQAA